MEVASLGVNMVDRDEMNGGVWRIGATCRVPFCILCNTLSCSSQHSVVLDLNKMCIAVATTGQGDLVPH